MRGIAMNRPVRYDTASMRYFDRGERYCTRFFRQDVLILVFEGVLRFFEDGKPYEVRAGQYHIQRANTGQSDAGPSDAPKYLYVHFTGDWTEGDGALPFEGNFDYNTLRPAMEELDRLAHGGGSYIEQAALFYGLLSSLYRGRPRPEPGIAARIAAFLQERCGGDVTLEQVAQQFHFSKNHIISLFREAYGETPFAYLNRLRLERAEYLLLVTSDPAERVAEQAGFHTYSQFYRLFVRRSGLSPAQWRRARQL